MGGGGGLGRGSEPRVILVGLGQGLRLEPAMVVGVVDWVVVCQAEIY